MRLALLFSALLLAPCVQAQSCDPVDYAAAKDQAATFPGRLSLATSFCAAGAVRDALHEQALLAAKHGARLQTMEAQRAYEQCVQVRNTIRQALDATKSIYTMQYANNGCKGTLEPSKK